MKNNLLQEIQSNWLSLFIIGVLYFLAKRKVGFGVRVLIALGLGLIAGVFFNSSKYDATSVSTIGQIYVNLVKMLVIPLVASVVIQSITQISSLGQLRKIGIKTISLFLITTGIELAREEMMLGNATGLRLILSNVLGNALKYSDEGEMVTLSVKIKKGCLQLKVKDNGIGMSEEQLGLLFRKFEKMHQGRGGQGIGLFMVKKLVDYFEGTIEVESKLGEGTKVCILLPLRPKVACC